MKLSENFIEILKNFSSINTGIVIKPGNVLRTIKPNKTVLAEAYVDEKFDREFGIYDLNKLLGILSLNKDNAEVEIKEHELVFTGLGGKSKIRQQFTEPKLIQTPPNKNINAEYQIKVILTQDVFKFISDVASILKCPNIVIKKSDGVITINAVDVKGEIVDSGFVQIDGETELEEFQAVLKIENLNVMPGEYTVEISKFGVACFTHKTGKLKYWIAVEKGSSSFK